MNFLVKESVKNILKEHKAKIVRKNGGMVENPVDFGSICKWVIKSDGASLEFILSDLDKKLPMNYIFNQCTINDDDDEESGINTKYILTVKRIGLNEF